MKKDNLPSREKQLAALDAMTDSEIDLSDIPEIKNLDKAITVDNMSPGRKWVAIPLDEDIIAWFKDRSGSHQIAINDALREYIKLANPA